MNDIPSASTYNDMNTEKNAWLQGFVRILYAPSSVGRLVLSSPIRPIVFAVLLWVFAATVTQVITTATPSLQKQQMRMQENDMRAIGEYAHIDKEKLDDQIEELRSNTAGTASLTGTIAWAVFYSFVSLFVVGSLFWILQRLFNAEPPPYLSTIAVVAYGLIINGIGSIVIVGMQAITGSIFISPSLAFLTAPIENTLTIFHTLLTKVNVFTVWEYLAVGIAVAAHAGLSRKFGIIFGAVIFLAVFGVFSVLVLLYSLILPS